MKHAAAIAVFIAALAAAQHASILNLKVSVAMAESLTAVAEELDRLQYFSDLPHSEALALKDRVSKEGFGAAIDHPLRFLNVDAEDLAEGGVGQWLSKDLAPAFNSRDIDLGNVDVDYRDEQYVIAVAGRNVTILSQAELATPDFNTWEVALFRSVILATELIQSKGSREQFYNVNGGGNDGFVWLLTPEQAEAIGKLPDLDSRDLPTLPEMQ